MRIRQDTNDRNTNCQKNRHQADRTQPRNASWPKIWQNGRRNQAGTESSKRAVQQSNRCVLVMFCLWFRLYSVSISTSISVSVSVSVTVSVFDFVSVISLYFSVNPCLCLSFSSLAATFSSSTIPPLVSLQNNWRGPVKSRLSVELLLYRVLKQVNPFESIIWSVNSQFNDKWDNFLKLLSNFSLFYQVLTILDQSCTWNNSMFVLLPEFCLHK